MTKQRQVDRGYITKDGRYIIQMEFTGHESAMPRWVLRFCNKFISDHTTYDEAMQSAIDYELARL